MAEYNCAACEEIRQKDPNLIVNGFGDTECNYLKNDTGIDGSSNDCTDLDLLNDCLVGNMADEIDSYDVCDWKEYMKKFVPNVWTVLKAIICAICGIWTNIHNLWTNVNKLNCQVNYLFEGMRFNISETQQSDSAYVVLGKGCSLYNGDSQEHTADLLLNYIAGGLLRLSGSIYFYSGSGTFTDAKAVPNFDNGQTMTTSATRQKNSHWGTTGRPAHGGELVYEIRIKKSQYPQVKTIYGGRGGEANSGAYSVHFQVFTGGQYAYGQHGWCHSDGSAYDSSTSGYDNTYDRGHLVPDGWIYIQCRMHWIDQMSSGDNKVYSPYGWLGIRTERNSIPC